MNLKSLSDTHRFQVDKKGTVFPAGERLESTKASMSQGGRQSL